MRTLIVTAALLFLLVPARAGFVNAGNSSKGKVDYIKNLFLTADKAYREKHYDEASAALEAILKIDPPNRAASILLHKIWNLQPRFFDPSKGSAF